MAAEDNISAYRQQKLMADRLRAQMAQEGPAQSMDTLVRSGSRNNPTLQYNPLASIANALSPIAGKQHAQQLVDMDAETDATRRNALDEMLSGVKAGSLTPQQMASMNELGIDTKLIAEMNPPAKSGLSMEEWAARNEITNQQSTDRQNAQIAASEARQNASLAAQNSLADKRMTAAEEAADRKIENQKRSSVQEKDIITLNDNISAMSGIESKLSGLEALAVDKKSKAYSKEERALSWLSDQGVPLVSSAAGAVRGADSRMIDAATIDNLLQDMKKLGGNDSNHEMDVIRSKYPSSRMSSEDALKMSKELRQWVENDRSGKELELMDKRSGAFWAKDAPRKNYYLLGRAELDAQRSGSGESSMTPTPSAASGAVAAPGATPARKFTVVKQG